MGFICSGNFHNIKVKKNSFDIITLKHLIDVTFSPFKFHSCYIAYLMYSTRHSLKFVLSATIINLHSLHGSPLFDFSTWTK